MKQNQIRVVELGRTEYQQCWELQQRLFRLRLEGEIPDLLLLTEHQPVFTIGKSGAEKHLLASDEELKADGVPFVRNDRGGDITYHGPGQLVGYPILDLHNYYLDLHRYLRDLEEVIIRSLEVFGLVGERIPGLTGVWIGNKKICAIGVKSSRWVTMHGFALNINTKLSYFEKIIPCGIAEKGVTSMQQLLRREIEVTRVQQTIREQFGEVFAAKIQTSSLDDAALLSGSDAQQQFIC
jgi:lipoyl(octanoyl) transferase